MGRPVDSFTVAMTGMAPANTASAHKQVWVCQVVGVSGGGCQVVGVSGGGCVRWWVCQVGVSGGG